jgi:hypothetical protein
VFWNPGGTALDADQTVSAAFSYNKWIADLDHLGAAVGYNLGPDVGTVTIGVQALTLSDIPANRQNGYEDPILQALVTDNETAATFDYMDLAVSVGFARYFFDRLTLGATAKFVNQSIDSESASAIAFDFGSVYRINDGWNIAARINNIGTDMTYFNEEGPLPLIFSIGTAIYPYMSDEASVMLAVDATKLMDSQQHVYGGAEVSLYDILFLRGGYKFNYSGTEDDGTSLRDPIKTTVEGFSAGAGIMYEISGTMVAIDYAYTDMDLFDPAQRITLKVGL